MRVSGFVMTDESGEVLAVSVGGSADLVKSLAPPESKKELVAEHERLVDVLRSPDHSDDLAEADKQEAELAEYRGEAAGEDLAKSHVKGYYRKDGTFVKEHEDGRQAAAPDINAGRPVPAQKVNAIADKHSSKMVGKGTEWDHDGYQGQKVPAADVSGLPEFSHKEVYGHDGKTSPAGTDFSKEFASNNHQGFVLKHPNGKRSFVDTQGFGYARYHAPVEDAPAAGGDAGGGEKINSDDAFKQISAAGGKNVTTTSGHINYFHNGQQKQLAHEDADDGHRYVDSGELKRHLSDLKGGAAKPASGGYDHPNVVGKGEFGKDGPAKDWSMKFAGTDYTHTGKTGNSMHDQTPVREFESEDGHRVWADNAGRVHADSTSEVSDLRQKYEASSKPAKPKKAPAKKAAAPKDSPAAKTQNEGYGYHGEALNQHIRDTHGEDTYHGSLTEVQHNAAYAAADKKFGEAAQKLVDGGHFGSTDEARDYLDSTHGRHLHDGATFHGGDISKVKWLAKDVADYKKKNGIGGKPMAKALLFVPAGGAAELAEMSKSVQIGAGSGD